TDARLVAGPVDGGVQVVQRGRVGLHQEQTSARGDGVGPLDVQGLFQLPAVVGIDRGIAAAAVLGDTREARRRGQAEGRVELAQVEGDIGLVVGVNAGNGLSGAGSL